VREAIPALETALAADPDLHEARFVLARALARDGQIDAARTQARTLLARLPPGAPQRPEVQRLVDTLR
jgi:cytochrome c-type biogenesis protein CcmH/NrfG